jgi:hypothetical protein
MFPWFSSKHLVKFLASISQFLGAFHSFAGAAWAATGAAASGRGADAELPPPKKPPIAWPIEEPTATPLVGC